MREEEFYEKFCSNCDAFCVTQQLCIFAWAEQNNLLVHSLANKESQYQNGKNNIVFLERRRRGAQSIV